MLDVHCLGVAQSRRDASFLEEKNRLYSRFRYLLLRGLSTQRINKRPL